MAHWLKPTCLDHDRTSKVAVCAAATAAARSDSLPDLQAQQHVSYRAYIYGMISKQRLDWCPGMVQVA